MAFKCTNCGRISDYVESMREPIGEYEGQIAYQTFTYCPHCHSDEIEETTPCLICGEEHTEEELTNGICKDCIGEALNDTNLCRTICEENNVDCELLNEDIDWFTEQLAEMYEEN